MATIKKFTDLEVWQLANELHKKIYAQASTGKLSRDFSLKDQISRSSGAVPDNIAEGFGRGGRLEFIQFLAIAGASASELQSQIIRCFDKEYFSKEIFDELFELCNKTGNKIGAFIKYLKSSELKGIKFKDRITTTSRPSDINGPNDKQQTTNEQPQTTNDKQQTTVFNTSNAAKPLGAYPHARKVGNLLFLSGIGSRQASDNKIPGLELDADGNILKYDIEAECRSVFANVEAVLKASGSSRDKIVDVTVFLTNMKVDFPVYNKIYGEYFKDVEACRTTVEVKSLPTPIAIELKVIATI